MNYAGRASLPSRFILGTTELITLDMVGHSCLTEYLSRPLTRQETAKLSPAEMKARRLAQTRTCRHRQKVAEALAKVAAANASTAGRDVIDLYAYHLINA
jgi:hypothetical protein